MAKKSAKTIVHLRVYKGQRMSYDENGVAQNENHVIKIQHSSIEWNNQLKFLRPNAYCKVEVEKVTEVEGIGEEEQINEVKDIAAFKQEVKEAFDPKKALEESEDQKRIRELEEKIEALSNGKKEKKEKKVEEKKEDGPANDPDEREKLIAEYKKEFDKNIYNGWSNEQIAAKIAEAKN